MPIEIIAPDLDGTDLRIGVVQSRFNEWVGKALAESCLGELATLGVREEDITFVTVPGALEVPLALARMADAGDFDALIALGCVIRGETYHFEIVANESAAGLARVMADFGVPVANAILTIDDETQANARMAEKGREAARVAVEMGNLVYQLNEAADESDDEA